MFAFRIRIAIE